MITFSIAALMISLAPKDVVSVYDADTFRVNLPCDLSITCDSVPVRALGFDGPEIRGKCLEEKINAQLAKHVTQDFLANGKIIDLRNIKRGKYYRLIADVYVDGYSLSKLHIDMGLGIPYSGGKREGWCNDGD